MTDQEQKTTPAILRAGFVRGFMFAALFVVIFEGLRLAGADVRLGKSAVLIGGVIAGVVYGLFFAGLRIGLKRVVANITEKTEN